MVGELTSVVAAPVTLTVKVGLPLSMLAYCVRPGKARAVATVFPPTLTLSAGASANALTTRICAPLLPLLPDLPHPASAMDTRHKMASTIRCVRIVTPELGKADMARCRKSFEVAILAGACSTRRDVASVSETFGYRPTMSMQIRARATVRTAIQTDVSAEKEETFAGREKRG